MCRSMLSGEEKDWNLGPEQQLNHPKGCSSVFWIPCVYDMLEAYRIPKSNKRCLVGYLSR